MSAVVAGALTSKCWRELYKAALFETDKTKSRERIAQAELALSARARELFHIENGQFEERQAVDTAIYSLYALRRAALRVPENEMRIHAEGRAA